MGNGHGVSWTIVSTSLTMIFDCFFLFLFQILSRWDMWGFIILVLLHFWTFKPHSFHFFKCWNANKAHRWIMMWHLRIIVSGRGQDGLLLLVQINRNHQDCCSMQEEPWNVPLTWMYITIALAYMSTTHEWNSLIPLWARYGSWISHAILFVTLEHTLLTNKTPNRNLTLQ